MPVRGRVSIALLVGALALNFPAPATAAEWVFLANPNQLLLGDPPPAPADVSALPGGHGRFAAAALTVNPGDRAAVARFYRLYHAANLVPSDWVGSVPGCQAGSIGPDYVEATRQQINFFRAMAGVPATVAMDAVFSGKGQQAALMMSANNQLSHFPQPSFACYTDIGAEAARNSNIALGQAGAVSVRGYMDDAGSNNAVVGHRRWILYPQTQLMGTGDVTDAVNGGRDANALWVQDGNFSGPRPAVRDDFVAWPPPGYVPYDLVPARWSLSYPGADFSAASVTVTGGGQTLPVRLETIGNGFGENTLVWVVNNRATSTATLLPRPTADTPYSVAVSGARVSGQVRNFDYTVIAFDADPAAGGLSFLPAQPVLTVGRSVTVTASGGGSITNIQWSNPQVLNVQFAGSSSLKLTGLAAGSATVTATDSGGNTVNLAVTVGAQATMSDWQISGRSDGISEAMTLVADVLPASADSNQSGVYFVAALLPNGALFVNNGQTWAPYAGGAVPARLTGTLTQRSFPVFVGLDTRGLSGTQIIAAYGRDANDMVANGKFRVIFTIP